MKPLLLLIVFALIQASFVSAQQPAPVPTPKEVKIQQVTLESAALPNSNRQWIKVVAAFQSTPRWADGIVFNYNVLLGSDKQFRVLQGIVRYANVKGGPGRAVMYISPNTAERFGPPIAATVRAFYKDDLADEATFRGPGATAIPANWDRQFDKYPGLLLSVIQTPWLVYDYASSPDIFANQ
jgi:hypothetical protein